MPAETPIRPEILTVLRRLRRRVQSYVVIEGLALVLIVMAVLFWASLAVDWMYFSVRHLELPVWFRQGFAVSTFCAFAFTMTTLVLLRVLRPLGWKALALVLERRYPKLDDRLITAIELAEQPSARTPVTLAMLNRTVDDAVRMTRDLELRAVFNEAPIRRSVVAAVVLLASVGGLAWANESALHRWSRAYVAWDDEYWSRETELAVSVIAQPGDRHKPFVDGTYKHPRGGDLTLLIEVPEGRKVPDSVSLQYRLDAGRGLGSADLRKRDDGKFQHTMNGLLDGFELWVHGGDYTNRRPYRVIVVDPPRVDRITLENDYPDYTGLDEITEDEQSELGNIVVQGSQVSLPMETRFVMHCESNKRLTAARVGTESFELSLSAGATTLTIFADDDQPQRSLSLTAPTLQSMLAFDGMSLSVPFHLSAQAGQILAELSDPTAVPLAADAILRIHLEDTDGIIGLEPARLTVSGIADQPPVIESELRGIGSAITRKAVVPVKGAITDDYGVAAARFEFRIDDESDWRPRPFRNPPPAGVEDFVLQRDNSQEFERFEVLPLDLQVGQKLTLCVFAVDGDALNGPHASRGEQYVFNVVSDEELLSILYSKELNLRRRFEQIIRETEKIQEDLKLHRRRAAEALQFRSQGETDADAQRQIEEIDIAVSVCAERSLHQVRKGAGETASVAESFGEIIQELINNAVHTSQMVERLSSLIVRPLHRISEIDYPEIDGTLGLFRLANEQGSDPTPAIDDSSALIANMLQHMRAVLEEMEELVEFHEAVKDLKSIHDDEEALSRETESLRKKKLIEGLRDLQ